MGNQKYSGKIVRRALVLYEQDQAMWQERQALAGALEEMDVPVEYLERAAAEVLRDQRGRGRRAMAAMAGVLGLAVVVAITWSLVHRNAGQVGHADTSRDALSGTDKPAPMVLNFPDIKTRIYHHVSLDQTVDCDALFAPGVDPVFSHNIDTQASLQIVGEPDGRRYAHIVVDYFAPSPSSIRPDTYWADLHTRYGNKMLEGYRTVTFRARGVGLPKVHFMVTVVNIQQWVVAPVMISKDWRNYTFDLNGFYHRALVNDTWQTVGNGSPEKVPGQITNVEFHLGDGVNDIKAHGYVDIGEVTFQ